MSNYMLNTYPIPIDKCSFCLSSKKLLLETEAITKIRNIYKKCDPGVPSLSLHIYSATSIANSQGKSWKEVGKDCENQIPSPRYLLGDMTHKWNVRDTTMQFP